MRHGDITMITGQLGLDGRLDAVDRLMLSQIPVWFQGFLTAKLSAGKRLRPILLLSAAGDSGEESIKMAAAVELVHKASLLHDALSDERLGPEESYNYLLAGDYLLAAGLEMAAEVSGRLASQLAGTVKEMAEGQALQLSNLYKADPTSDVYQEVITKKTASLFAFSCGTGARLEKLGAEQVKVYYAYGLNFGLAFQLIDDVKDGEFDKKHKSKAMALARKHTRETERLAPQKNLAYLASLYLSKTVGNL